ncbi:MAG: SWIM zinc finger domain-containing protein, partial [Alkalispirochaeta sp.]
MTVNHDDDGTRRNLEFWRALVRQLPLEDLLSGPGQWEKALRLHDRGACTIRSVDDGTLVADVDGETGSYTITLRNGDRDIESYCTCPSPYVPCKHVGALLFGLMDDTVSNVPDGTSPATGDGWLSRFAGTARSMYVVPGVDPGA